METRIQKNVFITGASSGIGYESVLRILNMGHKVIAPCRDLDRAREIVSKFESKTVKSIDIKRQLSLPIIDLSRLSSIENVANQLLDKGEVIDSLVLNAGLQYTGSKEPRWSFDGFELTFAVNHLSHQYLTQRLIPLLTKSTSPRIVITSSEVHNPESPGGKIGQLASLGELKGLKSGERFTMIDGNPIFNADKAYKDSKLCNILFGRELYKRLNLLGNPIPVLCWAPGLIIPRSNGGFFRYSRKYNPLSQRLFAIIARDILKITETEVKAGEILTNLSVNPKYEENRFSFRSNRLIRPGKKIFEESEISKEAANNQLAKDLWDLSNSLLKISQISL